MKVLLRHPEVAKCLDLQSLDLYFTYGYIPAPYSIYKGIKKLLPGHLLKINSNGIHEKQYWDLYFHPINDKPEKYFIEKFDEIFADAVKMRLLSDVPLGAFLSGGIDSCMVVSKMAGASSLPPNTFTAGFSGDIGGYLDERPFAKIMADTYKCNHNEIEVAPDINTILDEIVTAFDEPFADDSVIPTYYICRFSSKAVTVALTGLGGDELFAGYERYLGFQLSLLYDFMPNFISNKFVAPIVNRLPEQKSGNYLINHMKRFVRAANKPVHERYTGYVSMLDRKERSELFLPSIAEKIDFDISAQIMTSYFNSSDNAKDPMDRMLYQDIKTYLPDEILTLTDRISMLHSQELRVPFTDHVLMEFCATIPASMKIKNLKKKYLLRKISSKYVPKEVTAHRKQGFASPMAKWLMSDLKPVCEDLLSKEKIEKAGILNFKFVDQVLADHIARKELNNKLIFSLIMFQKWQEQSEMIP